MVYTEHHPRHSIERLVPDDTVNLILEMGNVAQYIYDNQSLEVKQEYKGSWISGMQSAPAVKHLREQLLEAAGPSQKLQLASEWLYRRMTEQGVPEVIADQPGKVQFSSLQSNP